MVLVHVFCLVFFLTLQFPYTLKFLFWNYSSDILLSKIHLKEKQSKRHMHSFISSKRPLNRCFLKTPLHFCSLPITLGGYTKNVYHRFIIQCKFHLPLPQGGCKKGYYQHSHEEVTGSITDVLMVDILLWDGTIVRHKFRRHK